jgi:hypothetical protein
MVGKKEETEKDMREMENYNTKDNTIYMYSDGSVRYMTKEGTYAWVVANKTKNGQVKMSNIRAIGKEKLSKLECVKIHSYRTEALALMTGLMYLKERKWKGNIQWYTDSQSIITTWNKLNTSWEPNWVKYKDRDVWRMIYEEKKWAEKKMTLHWVKAHTDNKKKKSTEDEKGNQEADRLTNIAYEMLENKKTEAMYRTTLKMQNSNRNTNTQPNSRW